MGGYYAQYIMEKYLWLEGESVKKGGPLSHFGFWSLVKWQNGMSANREAKQT